MLPEQFTDRRQPRPGAPDFDDSECWHLLLGDLDPVRAIVAQAQQRLTGFTGLHMTPLRWLHATVLLAGRAADLTQVDLDQMLTKAKLKLNGTVPASVTLGRVIYNPEGIVLPMSPASALAPIFEAAHAATFEVTGNPGVTSTPGPSWVPHVTLCYSTSQQPAAPIIAALGKSLPPREVTIDKLSLVIQHGPGPVLGLASRRDRSSRPARRDRACVQPGGEAQTLNVRSALDHPRDETAARPHAGRHERVFLVLGVALAKG